MRLLLIRHAQTTSNVLAALDSGVPGPDLTELGSRQAASIPIALRERALGSLNISNMVRTGQTAAPLAAERGSAMTVHDGLREIAAGDLEMRSDREALERYVAAAWAWAEGDLDPRMPGAESGHEFFDRFDSAVDVILKEADETPVIFSHGASIRVWVGNRSENVPPDFAATNELHNTGSALVERSARGTWALVEWHEHPLGGDSVAGKSGPDTAALVADA
jgi:probable phosphoglycerate mutase